MQQGWVWGRHYLLWGAGGGVHLSEHVHVASQRSQHESHAHNFAIRGRRTLISTSPSWWLVAAVMMMGSHDYNVNPNNCVGALDAIVPTVSRDPAIGCDDHVYLDGPAWTLEYLPADSRDRATSPIHTAINVTVPGDLISDLQRAGVLDDPWTDTNFLDQSSSWDRPGQWKYSTTFAIPSCVASERCTAMLVFDGIKMGATILLNNKVLGEANDQFLRYTFDLTSTTGGEKVLPFSIHRGTATLSVIFDMSIDTHGRFMGATGGWDWAPLSNSVITSGPSSQQPTFSLGIWKSVYLATTAESSAAIMHAVPLTFYDGPTPLVKLPNRAGPFTVSTRVFLKVPHICHGTVKVVGSWNTSDSTSVPVALGPGDSTVIVNITVRTVDLWWPAGTGPHTLYNVSVIFTPESKNGNGKSISVNRQIGFRTVAQVTSRSTESWEGNEDGSGNFTMYLRVNGAPLFLRGSNHIPLEELEGRATALSSQHIVKSAAESGMNTLRVWAGGIYEYSVFYETADQYGLLILHDLMWIEQGHAPCCPYYACASGWSCGGHPKVQNISQQNKSLECNCDTPTGKSQKAEMQHQIRRIASHPSIVVWEACNECGAFGLYTDFVMATVTEEDSSRPIWPSSPSNGWISGVHRSTGLPNGKQLRNSPGASTSHLAELPCTACQCNLEGCSVADQHGPYQGGNGWCTITDHDGGSNDCKYVPVDPMLPPILHNGDPEGKVSAGVGIHYPGKFTSEFGCVAMSSFESMSASLHPKFWGIHSEPFRQRNHPVDSVIRAYFGSSPAQLEMMNSTGPGVFKQQLYQSQTAQLLHVKSTVEQLRSGNMWGTLTWQLGEIWPTGGWGVLEYTSYNHASQVPSGGRWKSLLYEMKRTVFADILVVCGSPKSTAGENCYVRNDNVNPFEGNVLLSYLNLSSGISKTIHTRQVSLAAGAGVIERFSIELPDPATHLLIGRVQDGSETIVTENVMLLAPPNEVLLPPANVTLRVMLFTTKEGISANVVVATNATALFITLATEAPGYFQHNAFLLISNQSKEVQFTPFGPFNLTLFQQSLRVDHLVNNLLLN